LQEIYERQVPIMTSRKAMASLVLGILGIGWYGVLYSFPAMVKAACGFR